MSSVIPVSIDSTSEAGRDPLRIMIEIAENEKLSDQDKTNLIIFSTERFKNRRLMAYISLYAIVSSLILLFLAAIIDGIAGTGILASINESQTLFAWMEGFLTAIVAAYFGVSAWRPAS